MQNRVYGHAKQGAAFGHTKIQGERLLVRRLNALAATISTPLAAPVIAATRLRGGRRGLCPGCGQVRPLGRGHCPGRRVRRDSGGPGGLGVFESWHRKTGWMNLFQAATEPPAAAASGKTAEHSHRAVSMPGYMQPAVAHR